MKSRIKSIFPFLIISFVIISSVYFFGPTEIFFKNASSELTYNYIALFKHIALKSVIYTIILSALLYALSFIKIFNIGLRIPPLACAIALILYMNAAFFKISGVMDGTEHIDILSAESLINTAITLILILISLIFYKFINDKKLYKPICLILITANIVSVYFSVTSSSYKPRVEGAPGLSLEAKDIMRLSDKENIVYIILDTFDGSYMDEILDETGGNEYSDMFKDFTYFKNYAGVFPSTWATITTQFVGNAYKNNMPFNEFSEKELNSDTSLFSILSKAGWENTLYLSDINTSFLYPLKNLLNNNIYPSSPSVIKKEFSDNIIGVSVYKCMPLILKNNIRMIQARGNSEHLWDLHFLKTVRDNKFSIVENPVFSLIHLSGSHPPYIIDENFNISGNASSISQSKASLKLVREVIEKMKTSNVYDNSLIIIAADHGGEKLRSNPILLMKMPYEENGGGMRVSQKPLTQLQMKDILLGVVDGSIKTADDIKENNERYFYGYSYLSDFDRYFFPPLTQYKVPHNVKNYNDYVIAAYFYPNQESWGDNYVKYILPEDFDKIPNGSLGNTWKQTKEGVEGHFGIKIKMPKTDKKIYNIKITIDAPPDTSDNYTASIDTYTDTDNIFRIKKSIVLNNNKQLDLQVFDANMLAVVFHEKVVLKEIEFIPADLYGGIEYNGKADFYNIADMRKFGYGLSPLETSGKDNSFLWSGGKNEIKLLPPSNINEDLHLELVMKPFHIRENEPQRVTFSMKGSVIGDFTVHSGNPRLYDIVIPKELLTQGEIISLNMELAYTDSPHQLTGSSDTRELGMMIYSPERAEKEMSNSFTAVSGWYDNEGSHIWGGKETELMLPVNKNNPVSLYEINGGVFLNKEREPQTIDFMIEDDTISSFTAYDEDNRNYRIFVPEKYSAGKNFITLKIRTSYETAPNSFTDTDDNRLLAFKINSVKHETVSAPDLERLFGKKRVSIKDIPDGLFLNGWYDKEKEHIWADKSAVLLIPVKPEKEQAAVSLEIAPYIDRDANPQTISFFTGDRLLGEYTASDTKYKTYDINIPEDIYNDGMLPLTIKTTYSAIPREQEKNNDDGRRLAIRLKSVKINSVKP